MKNIELDEDELRFLIDSMEILYYRAKDDGDEEEMDYISDLELKLRKFSR